MTENLSETGTVSVVRYPNRRLYDRSRARYVTLEEIEALIRDGKTVTIYDSKTGHDLTASILMQTILERHPERMDLLPVPLLHQMIRANDIVLGFLRDYLRQSLIHLEFWQRAASLTPVAGPMEWLKPFLEQAAIAGGRNTASPSSASGNDALLLDRIAELEQRLDALNRRADGTGSSGSVAGRSKEPPKAGRKQSGFRKRDRR